MTRRPTRRMPLISVRHRQIKIAAFDAVLMSSANIQNLDVNRGYEPAPSSGLRPPSPPSGEREGVRGRFVESPLSLLRMHWDHEPPLTRPSATLSPSDGEREGVRGRFMGKRAGDDQSERAVSGVTPTTSRLYPRGCQ